ncbi:hypothetical protein SCP_0308300 [Sparassis crispa]|uniref:Uncharacterized protein n=1 Tax=Sparassis crispa TaxID=139825 RepID=A0A401GG54_9APHY|nr:hypothetical protein SCP_0308300 [Sparassis crispa]GBE81105.1 hypothetical protein SCP_0308300 [Sparassis crispa]
MSSKHLTDNFSSSSSESSSPLSSPTRSTPPSLPRGRRPQIGIEPSTLIGKKLKLVHRSHRHPTVSLHFTDNTSFQILVDGYDPVHRGVPKEIEMDPELEPIFNHPGGKCKVDLTILNATVITLADKAFELGAKESRWDQDHAGIALKFAEDQKWHCVWATMAEYDDHARGNSRCVFRSYNDVYLATLQRPKNRRHGRKLSGGGH